MNKASEYMQRAQLFVLDVARKSAREHDDAVINNEREVGIMLTISALYDAKVKDEVIIRMLQKYWGLQEMDARERLRIEKTIQHPCVEVADYLMNREALTQEEADDYIYSHRVVDYLRTEKNAWKLSPEELLKSIDK
jgi:hypothetical protein